MNEALQDGWRCPLLANKDMNDLDDMLFGSLDSQDYSEDVLSDFSEEDLLLAPMENRNFISASGNSSEREVGTVRISGYEHSVLQKNTTDEHETRVCDRYWVISLIESMLEKIMDSLLEESNSSTITLQTRSTYSRRRMIGCQGERPFLEPKERHISFPGTNAQETWRFATLLRILELIHGALVDNIIMTKRDIYYHHPSLFLRQSVVDRYVDDIACTLGVTRSQMNVSAAAKGLVAGNFKLIRECGIEVHGMNEKEGMLVTALEDNDQLDTRLVRWILIIEKEATFRSLLSSRLRGALETHGIALTAKGYPDLASRKFLCRLRNHAPHIPVYALMDLDPDGIAILSTYKYGSFRLAHEEGLAKGGSGSDVPAIHWLGVRSEQISQVSTRESQTSFSMTPGPQRIMKLTARDRNKAARMLEWDLCSEQGAEPEWRQELQRMLTLNMKAEMQILDELAEGMVSWISERLEQPKSTSSDDGMLFQGCVSTSATASCRSYVESCQSSL